MCDPAPVPVSQPTLAQQAKRPAALQFGPDPPPAKKRQADLNGHVVWTQAATKDDQDDQNAKFLYRWSLPASLNTPSSSLGVQSSSKFSATVQISSEQQTSRQVP